MAMRRSVSDLQAFIKELQLVELCEIAQEIHLEIDPGGLVEDRNKVIAHKLSKVVNNDKEFRISMDVKHFKPEEIKITAKDNRVVVSAKHEETADEHGFISRQFVRQYVLPKDVDPKTVASSLNQNGVLTLKAPKMALEAPNETAIPITMEKQ